MVRWLSGLELAVVAGCVAGGFASDWSAVAIAVIVPVGVGACLALPPAVDALIKLVEPSRRSPLPDGDNPDRIDGVELQRDGNGRFDFLWSYPSGWARSDPENGDGNTYVSPVNAAVKVAFFGQHHNGRHVLQWCQDPRLYKGTIEGSQAAGGQIWCRTDERTMRMQIPGWRIIEVQQSQDGSGTQHLYQWFDADDRIVGFYGQAPIKLFPRYLPLFLRLIETIHINSRN